MLSPQQHLKPSLDLSNRSPQGHLSVHNCSASAMRLPYAPSSPASNDADTPISAVYARLKDRRAPRPLLPLDLTLLHSPLLADGYNSFLGAVRSSTSLPQALLELAICQVAVLTGAVFMWEAHSVLALRAGVSRSALEGLLNGSLELGEIEGLEALDVVVLSYVREVTRDVSVSDKTFEDLRFHFCDKQVVELTVAIGAYCCVGRILVPLNVGERNGAHMVLPDLEED